MRAEADNGVGLRLSTLVLVIGALTVFRFWSAAHIGLAPDETYYWLWSRFPAAGYFDHPPMIAWWIAASTRLFGDTAFAIRAPLVLSVVMTTVAVYRTCIELELGERAAGLAALWLNAMFLVGGLALIATPDSPSVMFWALATWALARLRRTGNPVLWLVAGLLAGLGCVSKYTNLFLGVGFLVWCIAERNARRWFISPWLYAGGVAALVAFLPVIVWNAEHQWVSFYKQFGRIDGDGFTWRYLGEFFAAQFGLLNPLVAIFSVLALGAAWRGADRRGRGAVLFLVATIAPLILYMLVHSLHSRVQGNWLGPAYPAMAILAAMAASSVDASPALRRMAGWVAPVGIGGFVLAATLLATPVGARLSWSGPVDLLLGWPQFAGQVEHYRRQIGAQWIATTGYGLTGELAFHSGRPDLVHEVTERVRYAFQPAPTVPAGEPVLVVVKDAGGHDLEACFQSVAPVAVVTRSAGERAIESYHLFEARGAAGTILSKGCE